MPTTAVPNLLQDPGYLFWAPLLTSEPVNTVLASKFTDAWPVAWISLGATEEGSTFKYSTTAEPVRVAEFFDPIKYATTERSGEISMALADYTLNNLKRALNGGVVSLVSGAGPTALNKYEPPMPGAEVRAMIGWESLDNTVRIIMRQCLQAGEMESAFAKAPEYAKIACTFQFEFPSTATPFSVYSAGSVRVGV